MTIVLVGAHGVGKTTLGVRLAARLGLPFHDEIGRRLAEDPSWRAPGDWAGTPQDAFDDEVFRRELARDRDAPPDRVVESWHPVNAAYAARRSPAVLERWWPDVDRSARLADAVVVPLTAPDDVLRDRMTEPGDAAFFADVGRAAPGWAARLGLPVLPPLSTCDAGVDELVDRVLASLERAWNASS